jgi:hypothetical protein
LRYIVPHILLLCISSTLPWNCHAQATTHHRLKVDLDPFTQTIAVQDTIDLPPTPVTEQRTVMFELNAGLEPRADDPMVKLQALEQAPGPSKRFTVHLPQAQRSFALHYQGRLVTALDEPSRTKSISIQQVFLSLKDLWYPHFDGHLLSFTLEVRLPPGWTAISQGERTEETTRSDGVTVQWTEANPQDDIYLIAGPYHEFQSATPIAKSLVFLHDDDPDLATPYLEATGRYLELYQQLLGTYPYAKFALVENIRETGYGMPSFTLLGSRVIRLPFILHTSYPHEILHNWWGNGVYVDYAQGNWSEGLTAYLADHLIQERRGQGAQYRRSALQKYANYVSENLDFPLKDFRARHGEASQAIGYNKALMFFHMLRLHLGDEAFIEGLRAFYRYNRFKRAGFSELRKAFEKASGTDLGTAFDQWIERRGAPVLALDKVHVYRKNEDYVLESRLSQKQQAPPYMLDIPVTIALEGKDEIFETTVTMKGQHHPVRLHLPARPLDIQVDPRFDLFRRLDPLELPASLGQIFGTPRKIIVLPSDAPPVFKHAYRRLAQEWAKRDSGIELRWDDGIAGIPKGYALWLLGWENRLLDSFLNTLEVQGVTRQDNRFRVAGKEFERKHHSLVIVGRDQADAQQSMAWLGTDRPQALAGLARKLPHYGKYSYLVFDGDEPSIAAKGQWPVLNSPLRKNLVNDHGSAHRPSLKPREPLARFAGTVR